MMSDEMQHKEFEWAERMFANAPDVEPKFRDMLAMMAMMLMGNPSGAQHFYAKAVVDGATDEELARVAGIAKIPLVDVGNMAENLRKSTEEAGGMEQSHPGDQPVIGEN